MPPHKMLAERIKARDPGNAPASGDRMSFLYIMPPAGQQASKLQGDRIETPTWIREKGLEIDFKYYMEHQLMNPISQLFAPVVHELPGCIVPESANRESVAVDYLFRDALTVCDKSAQKRSVQKLFGEEAASTVIGTPNTMPVALRTRSKLATPPKKIQAKINSLFVQQLIQKSLKPPPPPPAPPVKKAAKKKPEARE